MVCVCRKECKEKSCAGARHNEMSERSALHSTWSVQVAHAYTRAHTHVPFCFVHMNEDHSFSSYQQVCWKQSKCIDSSQQSHLPAIDERLALLLSADSENSLRSRIEKQYVQKPVSVGMPVWQFTCTARIHPICRCRWRTRKLGFLLVASVGRLCAWDRRGKSSSTQQLPQQLSCPRPPWQDRPRCHKEARLWGTWVLHTHAPPALKHATCTHSHICACAFTLRHMTGAATWDDCVWECTE